MKNTFKYNFLILFLLMFTFGCNNNLNNIKDQITSNLFNYNGDIVKVTINLKDGWSTRFDESTTYLYENIDNKDVEAASVGKYLSKVDYNNIYEEKKNIDTFKNLDNGFYYEDDINAYYIINIDKDIFYNIIINKNYDINDIYSRYNVIINN